MNARWRGEPRAELQVVANRSEQPRFVQEGREGVQQRPSFGRLLVEASRGLGGVKRGGEAQEPDVLLQHP